MSRRDRKVRKAQISFHNVQVGVAEAARMNPETDFMRTGMGSIDVSILQGSLVNRASM
jgi:hypothetical protein